MSNYDYENSSSGQSGGGSVLPWVLLTFITVGAGVGMFFFNMQKEQAMGAMEKYKSDYESMKKREQAMAQAKDDLEKQLASAKGDRDQFEVDKNALTHKVDELSQQLSLAKVEQADKGLKGKGGKAKKGHSVMVMKGHHRY